MAAPEGPLFVQMQRSETRACPCDMLHEHVRHAGTMQGQPTACSKLTRDRNKQYLLNT